MKTWIHLLTNARTILTLAISANILYWSLLLLGYKDYAWAALTFDGLFFGIWLGIRSKPNPENYAAPNIEDLTAAMDAFFADPSTSHSGRKYIVSHALDCMDEHLDRMKTINPIKDN